MRRGLLLGCVLCALGVSGARAAALHVDASVAAGYLGLSRTSFAIGGATSGSLHGVIAFRESFAAARLSGTFVYVDARGTLRGASAATPQPVLGSSVAFSDTLTVTRGTGAYRGLRGTLVSSASADVATGYVKARLTGTLRHGRPARTPRPGKGSQRYRARVTAITAAPGRVVTLVGAVSGLTPAGGVIVLRSPQDAGTVVESFRYLDGRGSIAGTLALTRSPGPQGTVRLTAKPRGRTRGTGRYAHVHALGARSITGSLDARTGIVTLELAGTLRLS